jgi:hypothetical protein
MKLVPTDALQLHPEAGLVPEARDEEFRTLLADVREHGIKVALEVLPGTTPRHWTPSTRPCKGWTSTSPGMMNFAAFVRRRRGCWG